MARHGIVALRLLLVAGLLIVPESSDDTARGIVGSPEPASVPKISVSAPVPALAPPTSEPVGKWLAGRRDHKRTYTRLWALAAAVPPIAAFLALGLLRLLRGWRGRFSVAGRAVSSRAPPVLTFA